jgi:hypothetical protein
MSQQTTITELAAHHGFQISLVEQRYHLRLIVYNTSSSNASPHSYLRTKDDESYQYR